MDTLEADLCGQAAGVASEDTDRDRGVLAEEAGAWGTVKDRADREVEAAACPCIPAAAADSNTDTDTATAAALHARIHAEACNAGTSGPLES